MAKPKQPLLSFGARGSLAQSLTFARVRGLDIAKSIPAHPDARTLAQVYQRWFFADAMYYWRTLSQAEKDAYRAEASRLHMAPWAVFLKEYLSALTDHALWLRLDERSGATAADAGPYSNDGTVFGALPVRGLIDWCRWFDGIDDYIRIPHAASLELTDEMTVTAHIRYPTTGAAAATVQKFGRVGPGEQARYGWSLLVEATGELSVALRTVPGVWAAVVYGGIGAIPVDDNLFHTIAFAVKKGSVTRLNIDGVEDVVNPAGYAGLVVPLGADLTNSEGGYVGRTYTADGFWWNPALGYIDDVRVYQRLFTPEHLAYIHAVEHYP